MPTSPPEVTTADLSSADSTTELFRAALGPVNAKYYLPRFARFDAADRTSASWNWAAALSTLSWLAFRQLWLGALAYAGAVVGAILLVFGIGRLVFQFSEGVELGLVMGFAIAAIAVPGLYGNTLLYAACRKKMAAALAQNATVPEACAMLAKRAPTLLRALVFALASAAVVGAAVVTYFELPHSGTPPNNLGKATEPKADAPLPLAVAPAAPALPAPVSATDLPATVQVPVPGPLPPTAANTASPPPTPTATPTATPTITPTSPTSATSVVVAPVPSAPASPVAVATTAPPPPSPPPVTASTPTPVATPATAPALPQVVTTAASASAPATTVPTKPIDTKTKDAKASTAKAKPAPQKTAPPPKTAAQQQAHFYVNVGLFADSNNALNAYVKLTDAGLPALKQEFNTSKGKRTRVRVGPYDTESQTQTAIEKVRALGLEAIILRPEKPPEKP